MARHRSLRRLLNPMRPIEVHIFLHHAETEMLTEISRTIIQIKKELEKIMPTLQERFDGLNAGLDEASKEILAELGKLREGGTLTPEQEESLARAEAKVAALKDTSPPVE